MSLQRSSSHKQSLLHELLLEPGDLPDSYGETRVVLLPIDPYMVHVYWEISFGELEKARHRFGDEHERSQPVLRFYDVTNIIFDCTNAHSSFDIDINLQAKNWYVHLWSPEKSYFVELGLKTKDSRFFPIARSNVAGIPPAWPAPKADERYMLVAGDYDLLETIQMSVEQQPLHGLTTPLESQAEPEALPGAQRDIHFEFQLPLTAETLLGRPAELYKFQTGREQPFRSEFPLPQDVHVRYKKECDCDLTEMSEKKFTLGVSSELVTPAQGRENFIGS